ncbi:MAG TPA: class I SAM-dependent methyltransferase [Candidatus Acidoferrales bacterium]|nr:class I SAM-dependent methyltransferase [Candidatus Acidoferrales bacterium]
MSSGPAAAGAPTPALIFDTLLAHQRSAALASAIELGVFRALGEGHHDCSSIARATASSERGIRILCDFLTIIGLIEKRGSEWHHSPASKMFLDPRSPACVASISRFMGNPALHEPYRHLSEVVRTGRTSLAGAGTVEPENPVWVEFAHSMAPMMAPMTAPLGKIVLEGLEDSPVRVLDIAAGHGLFGIEVARQNPRARITAVDWALVLEVAMANAAKAGVADRYHTLPGSAFDVDFDGPYDIVLLTNFLHHFDVPTCTSLLRKVHAALRPGGRVAALEFVPNEDRVSPPVPAAFALSMLVSTAAGDAYTFSDLASMYKAAGFEAVTAHAVQTGPHTVVVGRR